MSKVTKSDIDSFVSEYNGGATMTDIAKSRGLNRSTVAYWLQTTNVIFRDASLLARQAHGAFLDESVFETVTPDSAYWVGFLMADSAIHKNTVALVLNEQDSYHLEKFREFMGGSQKIIEFADRVAGKVNRYAFDSARVVSSLKRYGVGERKSLTAQVSQELAFNVNYWRGVVDGDGHLGIPLHRGKPQAKLELCGSRFTCGQFSDFVSVHIPHTSNVRPMRTIYRISFAGKTAQKIVNLLYDNAGQALDRKATLSYQISLL